MFLRNMKMNLANLKYKWWYKLLSRPDIYLKALLVNSIYIGIVTGLVFAVFQFYSTTHQQTIPPAFHSVLGVVLGLLLVFRTNTAYDRWWKAREYFSKFEVYYIYCTSKIRLKNGDKEIEDKAISYLTKSLDCLQYFLVEDHNILIKKDFLKLFYSLHQLDQEQQYGIDATLKEILDVFTSLERIRDTPIPTSYSLHIKVSIFLYFLTLPFGILYETGYWSIPLVMILYYIVAGIEIISNEIENPFYGDPNDLPVKYFILTLKEEIVKENTNDVSIVP